MPSAASTSHARRRASSRTKPSAWTRLSDEELLKVRLRDLDLRIAGTPLARCVRRLYAEQNVLGLPGSYLARDVDGQNPGRNRVRLALVAPKDECVEAVNRITEFARRL